MTRLIVDWKSDPFPHAIIDNFLPSKTFDRLKESLQNLDLLKEKEKFATPIERKTIFTNHNIGEPALDLIELLGSHDVKRLFEGAFGANLKILSMGETKNFSGLSPFHLTDKGGFLGSHIDHSSIDNYSKRHICNSIYYASDDWQDGWGGETQLFSKHGISAITRVEPRPNRLLLFIHSANSFHGVTPYNPTSRVPRKTFYHDYYCEEADIKSAMSEVNQRFKCKLKHSHHDTVFIPFFPQGINLNGLKNLTRKKHYSYAFIYFIYLINRLLGVDLKSLKVK